MYAVFFRVAPRSSRFSDPRGLSERVGFEFNSSVIRDIVEVCTHAIASTQIDICKNLNVVWKSHFLYGKLIICCGCSNLRRATSCTHRVASECKEVICIPACQCAFLIIFDLVEALITMKKTFNLQRFFKIGTQICFTTTQNTGMKKNTSNDE